MEHHFNIDIAKDYGIEEAIILHSIFFWLSKNASNNKHFYDGLYWFYNSKKAFVEMFPYMNETKISRSIKKLEEKGIVVKGNYSKDKWDKTNWYALTKNGIDYMVRNGYKNNDLQSLLQNDLFDSGKMNDGACQNEQCIINYYTDSNTNSNKEEDIIISSKNDDKEKDEGFIEKIYKLYPTKCPIRGTSLGKSHADKKRIKALLKKYTKEQILMVVENEIKNKYGKYSLKNFSTFLNNFPDPSAICENSTPKQNTLFDNLPTGMIIRETQEERNEKFKNEKGW